MEACHDLGTRVVAPDCGFYSEQRPCLSYAASGPARLSTLTEAVHRAFADRTPPRADPAQRASERLALARAHEEIYADVLKRRLACTS